MCSNKGMHAATVAVAEVRTWPGAVVLTGHWSLRCSSDAVLLVVLVGIIPGTPLHDCTFVGGRTDYQRVRQALNGSSSNPHGSLSGLAEGPTHAGRQPCWHPNLCYMYTVQAMQLLTYEASFLILCEFGCRC